jgi:hypothetical protein
MKPRNVQYKIALATASMDLSRRARREASSGGLRSRAERRINCSGIDEDLATPSVSEPVTGYVATYAFSGQSASTPFAPVHKADL